MWLAIVYSIGSHDLSLEFSLAFVKRQLELCERYHALRVTSAHQGILFPRDFGI